MPDRFRPVPSILAFSGLALAGVVSLRAAPEVDRSVCVPVEPKMLLVHADGRTEPIVVSSVQWDDARHSMEGDARRGELRFWSDCRRGEVVFATTDPRAATPRVLVRVPNPAPPAITVRVPAFDHPCVSEVVLEVVDSRTHAPVVDSTLEWDEADASPAAQSTDGHGTLRLGPRGGVPGLLRFQRSRSIVHAPGHRTRELGRKLHGEADLTSAEDLERQLALSPHRVEMEPSDDASEFDLEERAVRFLDADGAPLAGALVWIGRPAYRVGLGDWFDSGIGGKWDRGDGFRRIGADGVVRFSMASISALEVRQHEPNDAYGWVPIADYALDRSRCPGDAVRDVRIPALASLELTVDGLPDGAVLEAFADGRGRTREPRHGPSSPVTFDPGVEAMLKKRGDAIVPAFDLDAITTLRSNPIVYRRPVVVGRTTTIYLSMVAPKCETRTVEFIPSNAGRLELHRRWADLPFGRFPVR